jgi:HAE1 family hydrophobic/amphiphilic exporter-1
VVTLAEALAIADAQNRDVEKAREYRQWVEGKYLEERAAGLPQATFKVALLRQFDDSQSKLFAGFSPSGGSGASEGPDIGEIFGGRQDIRSADFSVTQAVFTWGKVGAAVRAAKMGFSLSDQQLRRFRQAVARDVTTAFWNVLAARELERIANEDLAQRARHLEETTKRQSAGTATDYDVLAAQVAVENGRPSIIRAQNLIRAAREQLRFLLAETTSDVDVSGTLAAAAEPMPPHEEVLEQALKNRPEIGELDSQRGVYVELLTIARADNKPRVDFATGWGRRSLALKTLSASGTTWNASIFATVPLFDGMRTKGRIAQVQSEIARLSLDGLKLRESIALEVRLAVDAVREATDIMSALGGTLTQAETLLFLSEKGYELGVKTRLEVQDAELNLRQARANMAAAQRGYRVARANLEWVMGTGDGGSTTLPEKTK